RERSSSSNWRSSRSPTASTAGAHIYKDESSALHSCLPKVHPVADERHALATQQPKLARALRHASVGTHHAVPGQSLGGRGEHAAGHPRRERFDVAIGPDESSWDRADPFDDPRFSSLSGERCLSHTPI